MHDGRVLVCDWLNSEAKGRFTAKADVGLFPKMATWTSDIQTSRGSTTLLSNKRTVSMAQTKSRLLGNNCIFFLTISSMMHMALADGKTLVLLDNLNIRDTHSIFFRSLAGEKEYSCFSQSLILR